MFDDIEKLASVAAKEERHIIGLMSGTSLDGLDIALCRVAGSGDATRLTLEDFTTVPYAAAFRERVAEVFARRTIDLERLCQLNPFVAHVHAEMILKTLDEWRRPADSIDLIASHGQTVYHAPGTPGKCAPNGNATLQLGDGDHIAHRTGIITVHDFRQKQIAAGGEGAPLAAYGDHLLFGDEEADRVLLNIGGIANLTCVCSARNGRRSSCSDIGPGNTVMDQLVQRHSPLMRFDVDGTMAGCGSVLPELLDALLSHPFFSQPPPKTTGPETFNLAWLDEAIARTGCGQARIEDLLATLSQCSARSIATAIEALKIAPDAWVYVSGGGARNPTLMANIRRELAGGHTVVTTDDLGIDPDAKEAVLFAVLANETIAGQRMESGRIAGMPAVSMGKISLPG
ncbi:anhydro-N-acetylmuramic acid kinase [Erythrobacter sp.]|uniref:anhydro-N-acetylmuramic acid kinase n=1 Tax=Erythrobacter sp. TaxID=1042 RepID=UPI001B07AB57|nr:anhydro-N-acetylmuramic acid kinase [Erythrobacter sp.]MBO6526653.1 anhydro-N-acetylmuramic acid kinase [Erythrobacter sp.]MBO6529137.1 anhydro-N-acetylmuramic acid kinase [Erythrobacter sp.]